MKSVWNGSISFGLVNIPIKLYSAIESKTTGFRMLCKKCDAPVKYKRTCKCSEDVAWDDIVKGYEIEKDQYVVIEPEELQAIKPEKSQTVDIQEFVDLASIDPIYFNKHYYVGPSTEKEKAFFLLKEILQSTAKVAIGTFVMRDKEHVVAIESYKEGLLMTTLNYAHDIRAIGDIEELKSAPKLKEAELGLAKDLIDKLYKEEFDISHFKDTFADELKKLVAKKAKGETIEIKTPTKKGATENLVEALKASLK